jgi:ribosomal protein S18 acetylase RimI-like enzyme
MSDDTETFRIRDLRFEDCDRCADLHLAYFGPSIISAFGKGFLRGAYEGMVGARWGRTIVATDPGSGELLGFATLVFDGGKFFREILLRKGCVMSLEAVRALPGNPTLIGNVLKALRYPSSFSDATKAELLTLIATEEHRGRGVGSGLVEEVRRIFRSSGLDRFKVSVKKDWTRAVDFYLHRGFSIIGEIDDGKKGLLFLLCDMNEEPRIR